MTIETLVVWLFVGLIAGWLASAVVGGGYGIVGDIVVAFVGAVVLLLLLRALHRTRYRAT